MNRLSICLVSLLVSSSAACSSSPGAASLASEPTTDAGADDAGLTSDEAAAFSSSADSLAAQQETSTLADTLFDFDPTIDPKASPSANAAAIGQHVQTSLGSACGTVSLSGSTVSVAFGAPPGCTLAGGAQISGTVTLGVSQSGATTSATLTLDDMIVNGESLAGQSTFSTTDGSTFAVTSTITSGTRSHTSDLTIAGGASSFVLSGTSTITEGSATSSVVFTNVTHVKGECYATSGTMAVTKGPTIETITFDASTPSTGEVTVQTGKRTTTTTLPAYGACPSGAQGSDGGARR